MQTYVVAIQPNVPMSGLKYEDWRRLRGRHVELTENALRNIRRASAEQPVVVIFPESPMNFQYQRDREFQEFLSVLTKRNNVSILFNSAEPDAARDSYFNSAVMVNEKGEKIAQYDKIFLLPFGEYAPVPAPLQSLVPTMVGNFSFGKEYDLLAFGAARGGVMICFESHFPNLAREYARAGADVLIEMTNDGYLGNTPVLRQHLASAVFRAVETRRPVLRVTNVGVTAYINERGEISDAAEPYTEASRVWTIAKSDGKQTFYVKYGDWFAWLCALFGIVLILSGLRRKLAKDENKA
jgi:apolipoprotein N-acyltransferase